SQKLEARIKQKSEIRISKSETNPNDQNSNVQNHFDHTTPNYWLSRKTGSRSAGLATSFFIAAGLTVLYRSGTWEAIRSPWEVVPPVFFGLVFAAAALLALAFLRTEGRGGGIVLLPLFAALVGGVALAIFRAGYGFDPFIHQAAERFIQAHGFLNPRTFYYIGQYAIVLTASAITGAPSEWVDRLLVPVAATLLPLLAYGTLVARKLKPGAAAIGALGLFALPFSSWIATTPQSLANLFLLAALLAALGNQRVSVITLFSFAALATHPIAGVPALVFTSLLALRRILQPLLRRALFLGILTAGSIALPALFLLAGGGKFTALGIPDYLAWGAYLKNRFDPFRDLAYAWIWNAPLVLAAGALVGWLPIRNQKIPYVAAGLATLFTAAAVGGFVSFPKLPIYEQGDYGVRLAGVAALFFLPLFLLALVSLAERARGWGRKIAFAGLMAAAITASTYGSYPRTDKYEGTHGFNTSAADIHTVQAIEADAAGKPYIVLANQATSAAALREFGFSAEGGSRFAGSYLKTPAGELYFYSIPTGGPLYEKYLKMVYESPTRAVAEEAMDLAGVDTAYLAVSRYWTEASRVVEAASREADAEFQIDNGRIYVFRYDRAP
ncbi:MAG: hypothetical protein AAB562_01545, partial [Patescibacteria group bacterium]